MRRPRTTVLLPVYNEVRALPRLLPAMARVTRGCEVIAIDDGSTDGSDRVLARWARAAPGRRILTHARNRGKGTAIRTGLAAARGSRVAFQDADLETDPRDLPRLLAALDGAEAVFGTRFPPDRFSRAPWLTRFANALVTGLFNRLFGTTLSDLGCAYKAAPTALLRSLRLTATGFELEAQLGARLARRGARLAELAVRYAPRTYAEGKKIHPRDAWRILLTLCRERLRRA